MTGMGQTSFTAGHVSLAALMDSLVNILIPTCTWPTTNTAVEDLSNLRVREPHTPSQKSLMEPVKTTSRSLAASLILSPNYCWGHTVPCIPMASLSQADRQEGQISPGLPQFLLWEWKLEKQALAALFGDLSTHVYNTPTHNLPDLPPYWVCSQEAHQWNCRISQVRIFMCNQASNEWDGKKPLSSHNILYVVYKH